MYSVTGTETFIDVDAVHGTVFLHSKEFDGTYAGVEFLGDMKDGNLKLEGQGYWIQPATLRALANILDDLTEEK